MADRAFRNDRRRHHPQAALAVTDAEGCRAPVATTLAAALAVVVAVTALAVARAEAAAAAGAGDRRPAATQTLPAGSLRTADLIAPAPRDGVYRVVAPAPAGDKSVAMVLVAAMFLAMAAGTTALWRALGRSVLASARRAPVRRGRAD